MQYLSFFFWLASLCIIGFRFIHLIRTDSNAFLLWLSNIPLYICTIASLIHSSVDGHLDCVHVLAIVNRAEMSIFFFFNWKMSFSILQTCFLEESLTFRGLLYFFLYLQSPNGINYLITYFVTLLCPYQHHLCGVRAALSCTSRLWSALSMQHRLYDSQSLK